MKINVLQFEIKWMDIQSNIDTISHHLATLKGKVDLLVLPEMFLTGFNMDAQSSAIPELHPAITELTQLSAMYDTGIIGSLSIAENDTYYNRVLLITKDGIVGRYDKQYLFSPSGENEQFSIKYPTTLIKYKGWNILPQVCYDLRFPENVRSINQPDIIIYMANWPNGRIHHWNTLLKARAIENQCYVIGCNRIGMDDNGWKFPGHSQVVVYDGKEKIINNQSEILDLDLQNLIDYKNKYPFWKDKKS